MAVRVWTDWVDHDRSARVWGAIRAVADGASPTLAHAVSACAQALSAAGAGLAMTRDGGMLEPVLATSPEIADLDELQFELGDGPSGEAAAMSAPVLEPDLAGVAAGRRWPAFAAAGGARNVRGVFAFPVAAGAARVGVLTVYRREPGPLQREQLEQALVFADALFVLALDNRQGVSADLDEVIEAAFTARRAEVHQAAGRLASQQRISVTDALARLRAYAYSSGLSLYKVAIDVMSDRLHLDGDQPRGGGPPAKPQLTDPETAEKEEEED
ncbi:GAF and ANTAR domain-containing protein [Kribbella sp. VKM Ac-2569]|uniref:GAF and ANTAR domain-containing protein n=1 Tax=Kribbella sp. VKM Ac-2569 TaxID=2512220 RepID=UPI001300A3B9|nr:GAF and ANTAR domain-containing protein [Kribbella sp. VKM Ac-2569]